MKEIIKSFFCSKGKFKPTYFWSTSFLFCALVAIVVTIVTPKNLNALVGILFGGSSALIAVYNQGKKNG